MAGEWRETHLGQLGRIVTGKTPSSTVPEYYGGDIPFVTPSDFDGRRIINFTARTLSDLGAAKVGSSRIPAGSVMVSCIGSDMGKSAIAATESVTNQQINSVIVDPGIDALFMYYHLSSRRSEIRASAAGSAQPILNKTLFGNLKIRLPPHEEQRAIAHILGTLDDKIELNRRMSATLEAMARALFKSWFVDFDPIRAKMEARDPRLPPHLAALFPDRFVESELGKIPEGWQRGSLGDVAENPRRSIRPEQIAPDTAYIALEHMPKRCIALSEWGVANGLESNKYVFERGEILFGKLRPYFHKVGIAPGDGVCSTDIVVVKPRSEHWSGFVLVLVSSDAFVAYTDTGSTGTKMPRTSWGEMARYATVLPTGAAAEAFTNVTRASVERIIANTHESRTLAALRDALLLKLISGELRVKDAERILERAP